MKGAVLNGSVSLVDTHCHIHDTSFSDKFQGKDPDEMVEEAASDGVDMLVCVGTDLESSKQAVRFCAGRNKCYGSIALHPHEAAEKSESRLRAEMRELDGLAHKRPKRLIAVGECGLDYFYHNDQETRVKQALLLRGHFELAQRYDLPLIFHVRDAFEDFFAIFDEYQKVRGVVHSFSATRDELEGVLERGLYVGLNGIMTFTKSVDQREAARLVPLNRLLLETDAPFLTPAPLRGKMCEPKHVCLTAEFLARLRGEDIRELSEVTTQNAVDLFHL